MGNDTPSAGPDLRAQYSNLTFYAKRNDGLGERLRAIILAKALANHFGGTFAFAWEPMPDKEHHALPRAEDLFSADFIDAYMRPLNARYTLNHIALDAIVSDDLVLSVDQLLTPRGADFLGVDYPQLDLPQAFQEIGFSELARDAIDAAHNLDIGDQANAVHLRAGDIIYSHFRFWARYTEKVVPYPLGEHFIQAAKEAGRAVVVFGQDADFCRSLCKETGARFAGDEHERHGFNVFQAALFDIVLMSLCETALAATSGFALLATSIGRATCVSPDDYLPAPKAAEVMLNACQRDTETTDIPPFQHAFACWYTYEVYGGELSPDNRLSLLQQAKKRDPDNPLYPFAIAHEHAAAQRFDDADEALNDALVSRPTSQATNALLHVLSDRSVYNLTIFPAMENAWRIMAEASFSTAAAICAIVAHTKGDKAEFERFAALAKELPPSPLARRVAVLHTPSNVQALRLSNENKMRVISENEGTIRALRQKNKELDEATARMRQAHQLLETLENDNEALRTEVQELGEALAASQQRNAEQTAIIARKDITISARMWIPILSRIIIKRKLRS